MWDLPRWGIKPVSPALAGGVFTTEPPGKPQIHPSKKYAFVFFITEYSESFNPYLVLGFFFFPIRPPQNRYPLAVAPCASLFLSPGTTDLLSFYMTLPNLNISYKWNHTICGVLWLPSFNYHNVFKFNSHCSMYQYFILFINEHYSIAWIYYIFLIHSSIDAHLGCFHCLAIMNTLATVFVWMNVFLSLGYMPRSVCLMQKQITVCLTFGVTDRLYSTLAAPFYIPTGKYPKILIFPHHW